MKILTFTMNYADKRWPAYLEETFGKEIAEKCEVESHQNAKKHYAKITILNFKNDAKLLDKIKNHENVTSAYIAENKKVTSVK